MSRTTKTIKYTATIPVEYIDELKELASEKIIDSVNSGIREAIEQYIIKTKSDIYEMRMKEAAKDKKFMSRTIDVGADFEFVDSEVSRDW